MKIRYTNVDPKNIHLLRGLKAGQWITYTGSVITLRDSSSMRLVEMHKKGKKLPFDLKGSIIMYAAPTEGKEVIIGPTTSRRMDGSLDLLLRQGAVATIGKGERTDQAVAAIKKFKAPYLILMSGVSAYLSSFFVSGEVIAFSDLGPEAVRKYTASKLPLLVGIDSKGTSIF
jgi:fumarate hydratase subunit beta